MSERNPHTSPETPRATESDGNASEGNISLATPQEGVQGLTIVLPLPADVLRPNRIGGANKYAVSRARREARSMACHLACHAWHGQPARPVPGRRTVFWHPMPVWPRVRAVATFAGVSSRMDRPNAEGWLKATVDGISDALMGGNDHGWEWEDVRFAKGAKGVVITITPIAEGE